MPLLITAPKEPGRVVHITRDQTTDRKFSVAELHKKLAQELALAGHIAKQAKFGRVVHRADSHDAITLTFANGAQVRVTA
jgi:hypothetical protein